MFHPQTRGAALLSRSPAAVVGARTYYFSATGNDNNTGLTTAAPKLTIAAANALALNSGDILAFNGGDTFVGGLVAPRSQITYTSYGSGRATISGPATNSVGVYVIYSDVTVDNLIFSGVGSATATQCGIMAYSASGPINNFKVTRCRATGWKQGIYLEGTTTGSVTNPIIGGSSINGNEVDHNGDSGINLYGDVTQAITNVLISYNDCHHNVIIGLTVGGALTLTDSCKTITAEYNKLHANGAATVGSAAAGLLFYNCSNGTVQFNEAYGNLMTTAHGDGVGFDFEGTTDCILQYNYSHDNDSSGFMVYNNTAGNAVGHRTTIRFNLSVNDVKVNDNGAGSLFIGTAGAAVNEIYFHNNSIYQSRSGIACITLATATASGFLANNIFYATGGATIKSGAQTVPLGNTNLCFGAASYGSTPITLDPTFNAPGTSPIMTGWDPSAVAGYKLNTGSPALNAGVDILGTYTIGIGTLDFFGNTIAALPTNVGCDDGAGIGAAPVTSINWNFVTDSYIHGSSTYANFALLVAGGGATFSRALAGYYTNAAGILLPFGSGALRRGDQGALIEPAATNLYPNTGSFSGNAATLTGAAIAGPDGSTVDGFQLTELATNASHGSDFGGAGAITSGTNYVISLYLRPGTRTFGQLRTPATNWPAGFADFILSGSGGIGTTGNANTITITQCGAWYRCQIRMAATGTGTSGGTLTMITASNAARAQVYTGNTANYLYMAYPQMEAGTTASSYIPTGSGAITRPADVLTINLPAGVHDLTYTFDDNSTQTITGQTGTYIVPTNLTRRLIRTIIGVNTASANTINGVPIGTAGSGTLSGFSLSWGDDFTVKPTVWSTRNQTGAYAPGPTDGNKGGNISTGDTEIFMDPSYRGSRNQSPTDLGFDPISVTGGVVSLTADNLPAGLTNYVPTTYASGGDAQGRPKIMSGQLCSWPSFMLSAAGNWAIEFAVQFPAGTINGYWPAIWTSTPWNWPDYGEVDMIEILGATLTRSGRSHVHESASDGGGDVPLDIGTQTDWPTGRMIKFRVVKSATTLTVYSDLSVQGTLASFGTVTDAKIGRLNGAHNLLMTLAVNTVKSGQGTFTSGDWPKDIKLDYLQVWLPTGVPAPAAINYLTAINVAPGGNWTTTLPSVTTLYGGAPTLEEVTGLWDNDDGPGRPTKVNRIPGGMTVNLATRAVTGTIPTTEGGRGGIILFASYASGAPVKRVVQFWNVAPAVQGTLFASSTINTGTAYSATVAYTDFHSGSLGAHSYTAAKSGAAPNEFTIAGSGTGTLTITGTPTTLGTTSIDITCTNVIGQTTVVTRTVTVQAPPPTTYYFSATGSDAANGLTTGAPKQTISAANALTLIPGDIISFHGGDTFSGQLASQVANMTYTSWGTGRATISPGAGGTGVNITKNFVTVDNLIITGPGSAGTSIGIAAYSSALPILDHPTVTRCHVSGHKWGILFGSDVANGFSNGLIGGSSPNGNECDTCQLGINVYGNATLSVVGLTVSYNDCHDNTNQGIALSAVGGTVVDGIKTFTLEYNKAHANGGASATAVPIGIATSSASTGTIQFNESYGNVANPSAIGGGGISVGAVQSVTVQYNYTHGNVDAGLLLYNFTGGHTSDVVTFRYNLSINDRVANAASASLSLGTDSPVATNVRIYNNTIYQTRAGVACLGLNIAGATGFIADNIFFVTGTAIIKNGTQAVPLGNSNVCYGAASYGANAITSNPLLTDAGLAPTMVGWDPTALNGYRLTSGSPALNSAIDIAGTYGVSIGTQDFYGNPLGPLPTNIGSYDGVPVPSTYYFAATGSDSNDGLTTSTPKQTIAAANAMVLNAGDTLAFNGGDSFSGNLIAQRTNLTYTSYGVGKATISSAINTNGLFIERSNTTVDNLIFQGAGGAPTGGNGILVYSDPGRPQIDSVRITRCRVTASRTGIFVGAGWTGGCTNAVIGGSAVNGNEADHNTSVGISVYGDVTQACTSTLVSYNDCHDNGGAGCVVGSAPTVSDGAKTFTVEYNKFHVNGGGASSTQAEGFMAYTASTGTVQYNESYGNKRRVSDGIDGLGFDFEGCTDCICQYNYAHDNDSSGFQIYNYAGANVGHRTTIRFNISVNDHAVNTFAVGSIAIGTDGPAVNECYVHNNTVYQTRAGSACLSLITTLASGFIASNLFYATGTATIKSGSATVPAGNKNACFGGTAYGTQPITTNPLLTSPGTSPVMTGWDPTVANGYRLGAGSPALNAGTDILQTYGVTIGTLDFFGNTIAPLPTNCGAYDGAGI